MQLYIDGVLNDSGTFDIGYKAAQFYLIGALTVRNSSGNVTGANYFNGQLDDVQIYNRVLERSGNFEIGPAAVGADKSVGKYDRPDSGSMLQLSWTNTSDCRSKRHGRTEDRRRRNVRADRTVPGTRLESISTRILTRARVLLSRAGSRFGRQFRITPMRPAAVPPKATSARPFYLLQHEQFDGQNGTSNVVDGFALATR